MKIFYLTQQVSGLYIGSIMAVNSTYGPEYVGYGVVAAGILYVIMACIVYKYPNFIGKYLPEWLMATAVILIGLSLISIGAIQPLFNIKLYLNNESAIRGSDTKVICITGVKIINESMNLSSNTDGVLHMNYTFYFKDIERG